MRNKNESMIAWVPKTKLGKDVMSGAVSSLDDIFLTGKIIKEPQIIDSLIPNLENELIFIGGSSGKGGGKRKTPTKRTTRMHRSGRRYGVSALACVGNKDGYIGLGKIGAQENRTAIEKSIENAKLNMIPVKRGCGSWECACGGDHSIPMVTEGKFGSVRIVLFPAPKGIGLAINNEAKKIMRLAGIKDVWSKSYGHTSSHVNYAYALVDALKKMNSVK
jgi:small subunit ribosomal protein S5